MGKIFREKDPYSIGEFKKQLKASDKYFNGQEVALLIDQTIEEIRYVERFNSVKMLPIMLPEDEVWQGLPLSVDVIVLLNNGEEQEAYYDYTGRVWMDSEHEYAIENQERTVTHWKYK